MDIFFSKKSIMKNVLLTCPPMISSFSSLKDYVSKYKINFYIPPNIKQILSEDELTKLFKSKKFDAWIVGDDPATDRVLKVAKENGLKLLIKWGVGIDNVDINSCHQYGIYFTNTPGMFGDEVSDVAIGYLIMLSRDLHNIHMEVKKGNWYKPRGISLKDKKVAVIGYGNIGKPLCAKLEAFGVDIKIFDPLYRKNEKDIFYDTIDEVAQDADFLILTCPLNSETYHLVNGNLIMKMNKGSFIINVSRGAIIKEIDLIKYLDNGYLRGAALDVYEMEPLGKNNRLKNYNCILGSHNASNTVEAVERTNQKVLDFLIQNF